MAADRLVEGLTGDPSEDPLIYPTLTLYRHHLELELKALIGQQELMKLMQGSKPHNLRMLWSVVQRLYPKCEKWALQETREAFERLLGDLDEADPNAMAARYPIDKQGNQTLQRLSFVNLPNLRTNIKKMSRYLECIREELAEEADWQSEMNFS